MNPFRRIVLPKDTPHLIPAVPDSPLGSIVDPSRYPVPDEAAVIASADAMAAHDAMIAPVEVNIPKLTSQFLLAGKAVFTVTNAKGDHYTFKVRFVKSKDGQFPDAFFVSVKSSGGIYPYRYVGMLNKDTGGIHCTAKSEFVPGTKEYNVAAWACGVVINMKSMPEGYKIEHAGNCGRCAKTLTDPESIERGIGPDCWATMGGK